MAEEQTSEAKEELFELPPQLTPEKKEVPLPETPFITEQEKLIDPGTFWAAIAQQVTVSVHSASGKPIKTLLAPDKDTGPVSFTGSISFKAFPDVGGDFGGDIRLLPGSTPETPFVSLVLRAGDIMNAIAQVIRKYDKSGSGPGSAGRAVMRKALEGVRPHLKDVFAKVFEAIKEKSPDLTWTGLSKAYGEPTPTVELIYSGVDDADLDPTLSSAFKDSEADIKKLGKEILTKGAEKEKKEPAYVKRDSLVRKFILGLPEERFKPVNHNLFMATTLTLDEVEELGGKELADNIRATPLTETGYPESTDVKHYWYMYQPKEDVVMLENKHFTDKMYLEQVQKIWGNYGGGSSKDVYQKISDAFKVSTDAVKAWFKNLTEKLSPEKKEKVEEILDLKEGIKKVAYPDQTWAGPILAQVGALVGVPQAQWASELAGSLAAKFDYISYPKLEGGPSELRKLATLPLSPDQIARVERNRAPAAKIMKELYGSRPAHAVDDDGATGFQKPQQEEMDRLAEDTLLELAEATPSSMPDAEFLKELKHELMKIVTKIHTHPHHTQWPSMKTNPEDMLQGDNPSFDTVTEAPAQEELNKVAMHVKDTVQIIPDHPDVPVQFYKLLGTVEDIVGDIYMCPQHGPEPYRRYLVEFSDGKTCWFREDELRDAGSLN